MPSRGARRSAALIAALALSASSCTRGHNATPSPSSSPRNGGTLVVSVRALGSLDPAKASWLGAPAIEAQLFRALTIVDARTNSVAPGVATSWRVSPDGLTWTFRLGSAKFSDGRAVTADDFKFAFDRLTSRAIASDVAFQLQSVAGFHDWHDAGKGTGLSGVTTAGPATLVIRLVAPFSDLPYVLANPRLVPLEARLYAAAAAQLATVPVGNGPFRVAHIVPESDLRVIPNASYTGARPHLDAIDFHVADSVDDGWRSFQNGTADVAEIPPSVLDTGPSALDPGGLTPVWATLSFGLNLRLRKYENPGVRRALSLAIDRDAIARTVYNATKDPATGILPEGMRGFTANACTSCTFNPGLASRLLRSALGSDVLTVSIDHLNDATSRKVAAAIAADLTAVGVRAVLRPHTRLEYVSFLQAGNQDFAQLGWISDTPTPDGFLAEQLGSASPNNQTGYRDPVFDQAILHARAQTDEVQRLLWYRTAELRALGAMPLIPIVFFRNRTAIASRVHGLVLDGAGVFDGASVWVA